MIRFARNLQKRKNKKKGKKKMKKMLSVILCVLMLSGMCACGGSNSNQASQTPVSPGNSTSEIEEITFSLGDVSGTGTFLEQNAQFFSQKVSELSDGKMKVEIFSDGLLGTEDALMTNIQTGALEMANFSSTFQLLQQLPHLRVYLFPKR